jgi:predicted TPR repeat methyltransferase
MERDSSSNAIHMRSSGDMIADRRFDYAMAAVSAQDHLAAIDLFNQVLELVPHWAPAHFALGQSYLALNDRGSALVAFQQAYFHDPQDELGASLHLMRLSEQHRLDQAPQAYVRALFDQYAGRFDQHLVQALAYKGPDLLRAALQEACKILNRPFKFTHGLDLGCGTGLAARSLQDCLTHISGVDLSPAMIAQAERTKLYHHLETGSLQEFLRRQENESADLIVAADVFVYMGDLTSVFEETARCLKPDSLLAFSVQTGVKSGFELGEDLRFSHAPDYLLGLVKSNGLQMIVMQESSTRIDRGQDVPGLICVIKKP